MISVQNRLYHHKGKVDEDDQESIRDHPKNSLAMLHQAGVTNRLWLESVIYHHETIGGEGYPRGIKGADMPISARILAVSDIYCAMVSPRANRTGLPPNKAMLKIFLERTPFDLQLSKDLILKICILPPGTMVKLESGESAVVVRSKNQDRKDSVELRILDPEARHPIPDTVTVAASSIEAVIPASTDYPNLSNPSRATDAPREDITSDYATASAPSRKELEQAKNAMEGVETAPSSEVLVKIQAELKQEPDIGKLAGLISEDIKLAGLVIKTANSPLMGPGVEITSIQHALTILGLNRFSSLVVSAGLTSAVGEIDPVIEPIWKTGKIMALCSAKLSNYVQEIEQETAYMAGLFCAAGTLFLARKYDDYIEKVFELSISHPFSSIEVEEQYYRTNHPTVGYLVAKQWVLPENISLAIYHHHTGNISNIFDSEVRTLAALLALSGYLVDQIWHFKASDTEERKTFREGAMNELLISDHDIEETKKDVADLIDYDI